jgi:steroid delta-isomerase-like uncharacterized protein
MSDHEERNRQTVHRFVEQVFQNLNAGAIDELVADDFVSHTWNPAGADREFLRQATTRMGQMLADIRFVVEDTLTDGDKVAARLTASATAKTDMHGIQATGRSYEIGEIHIFRLRDGRIVEHWHQFDTAGMMRQLRGEDGG